MYPLLKLCGNHSSDDTKLVFSSTADYVGFVFAQSKRQVSVDQLKRWLKDRKTEEKKVVALFVNESVETIKEVVSTLPIDIIQCHGSESAEQLREVKSVTGLPIWKAIHHNEQAINTMSSYTGIVDGYIVDCKVGNQWGGTGVSFDWNYIPNYLAEGKVQGVPVFIAGGINPSNIKKVLRYKPDGIDVSSGIEEEGRKSRKLIAELEERMNRHDNSTSR
ncbi:phosphoribosylanthranilate isomerase [Halalkalibacter krulwichiae]|uniref:N-(5'-phosphoribosyl)anthranilate isomerase n=1 Tax=Halalkalibacter krulwichiae TaxID=199441 RepID=A0A1X9MA81_9BACI|nr:phosphoribosylanthranilate isomerase [Halalkalibacter krulwichiae]ARK30316.1 N-(5'-phosphoribosyl)anthranilate isomerase [Halalkalibacter krulwichiae]